MSEYLIPIFLFLLEVGAYITSIYLVGKQYVKTKYFPYLVLLTGFGLVIVSSSLRLMLIFTASHNLALTGFKLLNLFLLTGIVAWVIGFIYFRLDTLPFHSVLIAFLGGFTTAAFVFSNDIEVYFDKTTGNWNASYPPYFFLFIGPLIIVSFIEIVTPVYKKTKLIKTEEERKVLYLMVAGMILVLFWGVLAVFTPISWVRYTRPFLLPFGWLLWALGASECPLILSFSTSKPLSLIVTNEESSTTIFSHVFEEDEKVGYDKDLAGMLLSALSTATAEILGSESNRKIYQLENKIVIQQKIPSHGLSVYLLSTGYDRSILAGLTYFTYLVSKRPSIPKYEETDFSKEVQQAFNSISII